MFLIQLSITKLFKFPPIAQCVLLHYLGKAKRANRWQGMEKTCCCPYSLMGQHFTLLLRIVAETDKNNKLLAKVTEMWTKNVLQAIFIKWHYCFGQKCHILLILIFPGSAKADFQWGGKLNSCFRTSCV